MKWERKQKRRGTSDEAPLNMDFMQGEGHYRWDVMTGPEFEVDQRLHFPTEGVNNYDVSFMGMVNAGGHMV